MATHGYHLGPLYDGSICPSRCGYERGVSVGHARCRNESVELILRRYIRLQPVAEFYKDDISMQQVLDW